MSFPDIDGLNRHYAAGAKELIRTFYAPVLAESVRYDRQAGFFSSSTLVQVAAGFAAFIRQQRPTPGDRPALRLITGATWSPQDIAAFRRGEAALLESLGASLQRHLAPDDSECLALGLPTGWRPEADLIARNRLGTLAWLVAAGLLDVRVALPLDQNGQPYPPGYQGALYHPKSGVLWDAEGNRIAFTGSVNETGAAWATNWEKFTVLRSWFSDQDRADIGHEITEFEQIWNGRDPRLLVLALPRAVREHLESFVPPDGPARHDPLEEEFAADVYSDDVRRDARRLLIAPTLPGGERLVRDPLTLRPFPHQERVADRVTSSYPRSFLLCDEVGLGKTIEAGLALRALMLRGKTSRALILAPRSLVRQWQEELREKFALTAWFYDGRSLTDVGGRTRAVPDPWDQQGITIASRQLAVRQDRRDALLQARPWDVVIVDEAHAARRVIFGGTGPNLTLSLLQRFRRQRLARALWLLTATPMQLDPHEVHDLLLLCGIDGASWRDWGRADVFQGFFTGLNRFATEAAARPRVLELARVAVAHGAPELPVNTPPDGWTPIAWEALVARARREQGGLALQLQQLTAAQAGALTPLLGRQTPLAVAMFRYTRATLRALHEAGYVGGLAKRQPRDVPVSFETAAEEELYRRIDELCSRFYRLAELAPDERSGVGFLMAVFRKRLASCFVAFRRSLERRRDLIVAVQQNLEDYEVRAGLEREAEEDDDPDEPVDSGQALEDERNRLARWSADPTRRAQLERERAYLQEYITALNQVGADSKFHAFEKALGEVVQAGERVIVFTQYLDTLDFIRDQLVARYADRLACYSGRGAEVWDPRTNAWAIVEKAEVKARSRRGHPRSIQILLGTDAASEGLNLQQFSSMINYDLPWNPMRLEQRIGRIDRVGQESAIVRIHNLYVLNTIEEDAYHILKLRIRMFEEVVAPLQPILAEMPRILRRVAMGELELEEARRQLDDAANQQAKSALVALENYAEIDGLLDSQTAEPRAPASQDELARFCLMYPAPGMSVARVPEPGTNTVQPDGVRACLELRWTQAPEHLGVPPADCVLATFSGELADRNPPMAPGTDDTGRPFPGHEGVRLLTWGDPYLIAWLEAVAGPEPLNG